VAVMAPTLLGLNDIYNSVKPAAQKFDDTIRVERAIAVVAVEPASGAGAPAPEVPVGPEMAAEPEPLVRKAEAVKPLDSPIDAPSIQAPTPEPINF